MATDYEEKTVQGSVRDVHSKLRQLVLEGWMPFLQRGTPRNTFDHDEVIVYLTRYKEPERRRIQYIDPNDTMSERIA